MRNVHERSLPVPAQRVGALIDRLGSTDDVLWPVPAWAPPIRFDGPLAIGADGGHGEVRYHVSEYEPGQRVRFTFRPEIGLDGWHELTVEARGADQCVLRHVLQARTRGRGLLAWPLVVRWAHDAVIEDLLDNAEYAVSGAVARPARWSPWVRLIRRLVAPRPRAVPLPARATLIHAALDRPDFADAWQIPLATGATRDPAAWATAAFHAMPRWIGALMRVRNLLVRPFGIDHGDKSAFAVVEQTDREALLGVDAGHLDFRASLLVADGSVTVSTVAVLHNARGRIYMLVVKRIHPAVIRAMLRHAARQLTKPTRAAAGRPVAAAVPLRP